MLPGQSYPGPISFVFNLITKLAVKFKCWPTERGNKMKGIGQVQAMQAPLGSLPVRSLDNWRDV